MQLVEHEGFDEGTSTRHEKVAPPAVGVVSQVVDRRFSSIPVKAIFRSSMTTKKPQPPEERASLTKSKTAGPGVELPEHI